jgi:hypothetical protein
LILYSKKEGIGYLSPFGEADDGSKVFLSTIGCLVTVIDGLAVLTVLGTAIVVVEKFTLCIGSVVKKVLQFYQLLGVPCPVDIIIKK